MLPRSEPVAAPRRRLTRGFARTCRGSLTCGYLGDVRFRGRSKAEAELQRLLLGRPNFSVHTSRHLIASALWDYGEDALAQRALEMTEDERQSICKIEAWYESPDYPLPMAGQRITHNHVSAFAAVTFFEGEIRPLAQTRRRPQKARPAIFDPERDI